MPIKLRFDFWHLEAVKGDATALINSALSAFENLEEDAQERLLPRGDKHIRFQEVHRRGQLWFGVFLGIGTQRPAKKASLSGKIEDIPLGDDEGLLEEAAFVVDPSTNIMVIQRNRLAATPSSVIIFLQRVLRDLGELQMFPILTPATLERLGQLKTASTFKVSIAQMKFGSSFVGDHSVQSLTRFADEFSAPKVTLDVTVGKNWRRSSLNIDGINRFIGNLFGAKDGFEVTEATLVGHDENDEHSVLDFTNARLVETVIVEPNEGRGVSREARFHLLSEALQKHSDFLKEHFAESL